MSIEDLINAGTIIGNLIAALVFLTTILGLCIGFIVWLLTK